VAYENDLQQRRWTKSALSGRVLPWSPTGRVSPPNPTGRSITLFCKYMDKYRYIRLTFVSLFIALGTPSCVSTAIERSTNKHRTVLVADKTREEMRSEIGIPIESWESNSSQAPNYRTRVFHAYDVFIVRGVVARPGDGSGQATLNAVTLGTGEAIAIPLTLASSVTKPFTTQKLIVFYNKDYKYITHQIYDSKGKRISNLGY